MSYEDLEEARAKCAARDAAKAKGNGKRGRKPKSSAPAETTAGNDQHSRKRESADTEANAPVPKAKVAQMSELPEQVIAPVARMI
jgi:hypothetical protein